MADQPGKPGDPLAPLTGALDRELAGLREAELLAEATEEFGDIAAMAGHFDALVEQACERAARERLAAARAGWRAGQAEGGGAQLLAWPLTQKLALLDEIKRRNEALAQYTLAARNEADGAADIDRILEDLLALGALDEQGRLK